MADPMMLNELLVDLEYQPVQGDPARCQITDIAFDSRQAGPGKLFVCLSPIAASTKDGHDFVSDAYAAGCRAFLCERVPAELSDAPDAVVVRCDNTRRGLALISATYFGYPANQLKLIGVTGTKGKTTTTFMMQSIFSAAGLPAGVIGSNGAFFGPHTIHLDNTTPESYLIHSILAQMVAAGVKYCFMEASSQGFFVHRTAGLHFALGVFMNIAPDHISPIEHPDFAHYLAAKKMLFDQSELCFVNVDSDHFDEIVAGVTIPIQTFGVGSDTPHPSYWGDDVSYQVEGNQMTVSFTAHTPRWQQSITLHMGGEFNVYNALGAVCVADHFGVPPDVVATGLSQTKVMGRMEPVDVPAPFNVIIDYAHNQLSMEALLHAAQQYRANRILCVFGLDGMRSLQRRSASGEILGREADFSILTSTCPMWEDPDAILQDIAAGIETVAGSEKYTIIPDRAAAIRYALSIATPGDLVLLIGMGDRTQDLIDGQHYPLDERKIVAEYFEAHPASAAPGAEPTA